MIKSSVSPRPLFDVMGDMGEPSPASRLAILPATSHTALIGQADLMMAFIGPFLAVEAPKGWFD